jgi:hypothetical protein
MRGDLIAMDDEECAGEPLLVPVMREGEPLVRESLAQMRERAAAQLAALPEPLRILDPLADVPPYPVSWSPRCRMPAGGAMAAGLRE